MPTYGYRCSGCTHEFEVFERMTDRPGGRCPLCGAAGTRLFFPAGIVFKGSGFYKTDSRSNGTAGTRPATEAAPAPAGAGSAEAATASGSGTNGAAPEAASSPGTAESKAGQTAESTKRKSSPRS